MDVRKRRILRAVVDDYVATAEPVGSSTIARKYHLGVSPATIRNDMAGLEEGGYLEQPHASAGRVPSDKGYRYYVDYLVEVRSVPPERRQFIFETLMAHRREVSDLAQCAARLLAEVTRYLVLVNAPAVARSACRRIQFLPLRPGRALLVLVTEDGRLRSVSVEVDPGVGDEDLFRFSAVLTERFRGWPLDAVEEALAEGIPEAGRSLGETVSRIAAAVQARSEEGERQQVYLGGAPNLLRQPEFRDVEKAHVLLSVLEEEDLAARLLASLTGEGTSVTIGGEWEARPLEDCSFVAANYYMDGRLAGRIGVLGPRRMDYGNVMSLVEEVSRTVSEILTRRMG